MLVHAVVILCMTASHVTGLAPQMPPPRVVVDMDVVAETLPVESVVALKGLQTLLPEGPWMRAEALPRLRTFDMSKKFERIVCELELASPSELVAVLRLLFEEAEVAERSRSAVATRPLTAGEVVENWDEILKFRCEMNWHRDGFTSEDIDREFPLTNLQEVSWRSDVVAALRDAAKQDLIDSQLTILCRDDTVFGGDIVVDEYAVTTALKHSDSVFPLYDVAVSTDETFRPHLMPTITSYVSTADIAATLVKSMDPPAAEQEILGEPWSRELAERRRPGHRRRRKVVYFTSDRAVDAVRHRGIRTYHCPWSRRWGGVRASHLDDDDAFGVVPLRNLKEFREVLRLPA